MLRGAGDTKLEDLSTVERPSLVHEPALDGLRGLAVAAVVAFHLDGPGLPKLARSAR